MEAGYLTYANGLMARLHALDRLVAEVHAYRKKGDGYDQLTVQLHLTRDGRPVAEVRTAGVIRLLLEQRSLIAMELEGLGVTGVPTPPKPSRAAARPLRATEEAPVGAARR